MSLIILLNIFSLGAGEGGSSRNCYYIFFNIFDDEELKSFEGSKLLEAKS